MRVELESPYKEQYECGYVYPNSEGRKSIWFTKNKRVVKGISYARYLFAVKLGHEIPQEFDVDHIDEDKTNDSIDNLQLLTRSEHAKKTMAHESRRAKIVDLICPICQKQFEFPKRNLPFRKNPCCSRTCGYQKAQQTSEQNWARMGRERGKSLDLVCPICKQSFQFPERLLKVRPNPACSRSCGRRKVDQAKKSSRKLIGA